MNLKKILSLTIILCFVLMMINVKVDVNAYTLVPLTSSTGSNITYRSTSTQVYTPDVYEKQKYDFRGMWVSPYAGDISTFYSLTSFQSTMNTVLNKMETFNMNALVFHIRIKNDALYPSQYNIKSTYMGYTPNSSTDPITWLVGECHRRGIEFHAWMNPYRVETSATALSTIASRYASCPNNPASSTANLLLGTNGVILNPGLPNVRTFLVNTVMEVIQNYDVDAIHFDDYFYISGVNDAATMAMYNPGGLTEATWRREQVSLYIQELITSMRNYNNSTGRKVQLGIAPTGVYANSNYAGAMNASYDGYGTYQSNGSNTAGQEHRNAYLYADTKRWIDNEWIDYILPQSYWGFEDYSCKFADVIDWWAKVVKYKKVNLYAGMGLYMAANNDSGWTHTNEAAKQLKYITKHPEVKGTCVYTYKSFNSTAGTLTGNIAGIQSTWNYPSLMPEMQNATPINLGQVPNFSRNSNQLTWSSVNGARRYAIYRSTSGSVSGSVNELLDIVGPTATSFTDYTIVGGVSYTYGITAISQTNTEGTLTTGIPVSATSITINGAQGIQPQQSISLSATVYPTNVGQTVTWSSSNNNIATVNSSGLVTGVNIGTAIITATSTVTPSVSQTVAIVVSNKNYSVTCQTNMGNHNITVNSGSYGTESKLTVTPNVGYEFLFLADKGKLVSYSNPYKFRLTDDHEFVAYCFKRIATPNLKYVVFIDSNNDILKYDLVLVGNNAVAPNLTNLIKPGYAFNGWSRSLSNIQNHTIIKAVYVKTDNTNYTVSIVGNGYAVGGSTAQYDQTVNLRSDYSTFRYWTVNGQIASFNRDFSITLYKNTTVTAISSSSTEINSPRVFVNHNFKNTSSGYLFVAGGFYMPTSCTLVDVGMIFYVGTQEVTLNSGSISKVRAYNYSANNEFVIIKKDVVATNAWKAKPYITYLEAGVLKTAYGTTTTL